MSTGVGKMSVLKLIIKIETIYKACWEKWLVFMLFKVRSLFIKKFTYFIKVVLYVL